MTILPLHSRYVYFLLSQDYAAHSLSLLQLVDKLTSPDDNWAIDGTVLQHSDGKMYFLWSGWANANATKEQNLYIARMSSPTQIDGERVLLHEPTFAWQRNDGQGVNEGPEILTNEEGDTFIIYCEFDRV
jgi:GH43 family beta-xylosidase